MGGIIVLSDLVSTDVTDILNGTRLQTAPEGGVMKFEMQSADADAANAFRTSIQLPSGDTPMESVLVPKGLGDGGGGTGPSSIDDRQALIAVFPIAQGGHVVWSFALTGAADMVFRVTFTPSRMMG